MNIQFDAKEPMGAQGTVALTKLRARSESLQNITYTGDDGKAFNLTLNTVTTLDYATYDRQALLRSRAQGGGGEDEKQISGTLLTKVLSDDPTLAKVIERFNKLLSDQGHARHPGRTQPRPPLKDSARFSEHVEFLKIGTTVKIDMDRVDTDYWSVENTAERLVSFAKSLYGGKGGRAEHLEKMVAGIEQGFNEAKKAFGGYLPAISTQTVELAKKMLNEWAGQDDTAGRPEDLPLVTRAGKSVDVTT